MSAKIDNMQENCKCRLCGKRDKTVDQIKSECCKQAQKEYKSKHDRVEKVIHWKLCKRFKFDHIDKWYKHKLDSILKSKMHKILWNFEIQMDHPI